MAQDLITKNVDYSLTEPSYQLLKNMAKKEFEINVWDYIDIEGLNEYLDEMLKEDKKGIPTNIGYTIKEGKGNWLTLEAEFDFRK